jgi:hypothetical protein
MRTRWILTLALLLAMLLPSASLAEPTTYYLTASGGDDTAAIQAAFSAAAANPGSTIEFAAGDYYLSDTIIVNNLSGTVRGAGKDATVINSISEIVPGATFGTVAVPGVTNADGTQGIMGVMFLLNYYRGQYLAGAPLHWEGIGLDMYGQTALWQHAWSGVTFYGLWPIWTQGVGHFAQVNSEWHDIRMTGRVDATLTLHVNLYSHMFYQMSGSHRFTDCHYESMDYGPFFFTSAATATVGGPRPQDQCTMHNVEVGVNLFLASNTRLEVQNVRVWRDPDTIKLGVAALNVFMPNGNEVHLSGSEVENIGGVLVNSPVGTASAPSTYLLEHNRIAMDPALAYAGIEVYDPGEFKSQFVIANNLIEGLGEAAIGVLTSGVQGAAINNNRFTGTGAAAMAIGASGGDDSGIVVKGNNLQQWQGPVGIWLGAGTSGNTVVGGGKDLVLDEGTGNIVTGAGGTAGLIGEAVREAMMLRTDVRDLWK